MQKFALIIIILSAFLAFSRDKFSSRYNNIKTFHERGYYKKTTKWAQKIINTEFNKGQNVSKISYGYCVKALDAYKLNKFSDFESYIKEAEGNFGKISTNSTEDIAFAGRELAEVYLSVGNYKKAAFYAETAFNASNKLPQNNIVVKRAVNTQLKVLINNGYFNEAQKLFDSHYESYSKFMSEEQFMPNKRGEMVEKSISKTEQKMRHDIYVDYNLCKAMLLTQKGENAASTEFILDNIDVFDTKETFVKACKELGDAFLGVQKYDMANEYYERATKASKITNHSEHEIYCRKQLSNTYVLLEKPAKFNKNNKKLRKSVRYYPKESVLRLIPEYNKVAKYANQERFEAAYDGFKNLQLDINEQVIYHSDPFMIEMRELQNLILEKTNNLAELIDSSLSLNLEYQKNIGKNAPAIHFKKMKLANLYTNFSNDYQKAKTIIDSSYFGVISKQYSTIHPQNHLFLRIIGDYYDLNDEFAKASEYYLNAVNAASGSYGEFNSNYVLALEKYINSLMKFGNYNKARMLSEDLTKLVRSAEGNKSEASVATYQTLSRIYQTLGEYATAKTFSKKAYSSTSKLKYNRDMAVATSADEKAKIYTELSRFGQAEKLLKESILLKEKLFGKNTKELITTYNYLGNLYLIIGKYNESEINLQQSADLSKTVFGPSSIRYAESIELLSKLYIALGDLPKALSYQTQALEIFKIKLGEKHSKTADAICGIATIEYLSAENDTKVEQQFKEALQILENGLGNKHPKYAEILYALATLQFGQDKHTLAQENAKKALAIWESKIGKNNLYTGNAKLLLGDISRNKLQYSEAESYYQESQKIYEDVFSNTHPSYVKSMSRLAQLYYIQGNYDKSLKILNNTTKQYLEFTQKYFGNLSYNQKAKFWSQIRTDFEFYNSLAEKMYDKKPEITGNLYNNVLHTKQLLVSSSANTMTQVLSSKNPVVQEEYRQLYQKRTELTNAIINGSGSEDGISTKQLEKDIEDLEKKLNTNNNIDKIQQLENNVTWESVKSNLKTGEFAVEIIRYRQFTNKFTDSVNYAALIISPETTHPKFVKLQYGNKLEKKYLSYYRNATEMVVKDANSYNAFWAIIKKHIPDGAKIYLSPEGAYNQINVDALYNKASDKYVIDENDVVILTNTKELALPKSTPSEVSKKLAILCGNPDFYPESKTVGSIPQLKGAETEVISIEQIIKKYPLWNVHKVVYDAADRDSLQLTHSPYLLHIATHGYFKKDIEIRNSLGVDAVAQNPLLRSGILLKGAGDQLDNANHKYKGGVFSAYEALDLNLKNTELVVLSACETGRGEIQIGEGILGLQRGLFVSGAKNIMMSLFKVSDEVTPLFMSKFYQNWLQTNDLRGSFRTAVLQIREKYPVSRNWGSFVLISR